MRGITRRAGQRVREMVEEEVTVELEDGEREKVVEIALGYARHGNTSLSNAVRMAVREIDREKRAAGDRHRSKGVRERRGT